MTSLQRLSFYNNSWRKFSLTKLLAVLFFVVLISFTSNAYGTTEVIPVGLLPFEVAINEVTGKAYVSHADGTVHVIDTASGTAEAPIVVGVGALTGIDVDPVENKIYAASGGSNEVIVIDGATKTIDTKINLLPFGGVFPPDVEVNTVTKTLYVSNVLSLVVIVIDIDPTHVATLNKVIDVIPGFDSPARFTFDPATNLIYMTNFFKNEVSVINGTENFLLGGAPVLPPITVGTAPDGIEINTVSKKIYSSNSGSDTVSVIDVDPTHIGTYNTLIDTIPVGVNPVGVGVNEASNEIYVSNRDEGTLSVISGVSDTVVKTIPTDTSLVPPRPKGVNFDSVSGKPYVVNAGIGVGPGTLSIIDLSATSPPVARAGPDQVVDEGALVTLDGSGSSDADGDFPLFYVWTQIDLGSPVALSSSPVSPIATFTAPLDNADRLVTFALVVDDDGTFATPSLADLVNIVIEDKTSFDVTTTLDNGVVSGSETIGDIFAGSTYSLQIDGALPSAELKQLVIPTGVDASGVTFDFTESSRFLSGNVAPRTGTALFLDLTFGRVDFSQSSNFESGIPPKVQFLVDSAFTSPLGSFADGCPVVQIQLLKAVGGVEVIGDPQQANTNKIYVSNVGPGGTPGTLSVIDGSTYSKIADIPVGFTPLMVDFDQNTNKIYVANQGSGTVSVIDGSTNTLITEIPVGLSPLSSPFEPIVNPNTGLVYVTNQGDVVVSVINGSTNSVIAEIPVFVSPAGIGVDTTLNKIFVANVFSNSVSVIEGDPSSPFFNTVLVSIPTALPSGVVVDSVNNIAYVSNFDDRSVSVIDTATLLPKAPIRIGVNPTDLGYNPTTNTLFVANQGTGTVSIIDTKINAEIARIATGFAPFGIDVNPNTNRAFIANRGSGTVSVIDNMPGSPTENTVIDTIEGFSNNFGVALNADVPNPVRDPSSDVDDQCSYIAQPPHFSKFAIGGVSLAILGGGSGGDTTSPKISNPTALALGGGGVDGFGGVISESNLDDETTRVVNTSEKLALRFDVYENSGVNNFKHASLYFNGNGKSDLLNANTFIRYDKHNGLEIGDRDEIFGNVDFEILEIDKNNIVLKYDIIFAKPMDNSDILLRIWDTSRNQEEALYANGIEVVVDIDSEKETITDAELGTTENQGDIADDVPSIPVWIKKSVGFWVDDVTSDNEYVNSMQYLIEEDIIKVGNVKSAKKSIGVPEWVKTVAGFWKDGSVTDQEYVDAMTFLIKEGIIQI
jgi:YVTN family beta-propeller protein